MGFEENRHIFDMSNLISRKWLTSAWDKNGIDLVKLERRVPDDAELQTIYVRRTQDKNEKRETRTFPPSFYLSKHMIDQRAGYHFDEVDHGTRVDVELELDVGLFRPWE